MTPEHPGYVATRLGSRISFYLALILTAGVALRIQVGTMQFKRIFHDLGAELPWLSQIFLDVPFGWILIALAAGCAVKEFTLKDPVRTLSINGALILTVVLLHEVWVEAMFQPLIALIDALG